jgi:hypothetical protein
MAIPIKQTVQENVRALLGLQAGESGVAKLMKRGFANGTAQRILDAETSLGIDVLERIAKAFDVEPWQLCAPNLGGSAKAPPQPDKWPFKEVSRELWASLSEGHRGVVEDSMLETINRLQARSRKRDQQAA